MIYTVLQVSSTSPNPWIPFYVVLGGFILTGISRMIGRYFERENYRKLFINNILSLSKRLPMEIDGLERRVESLNPAAGVRPFKRMPGMYQLNVFRDMTYHEAFKAYFTGIENYFFWSKDSWDEQEKLNKFNEMWAIVNSLENYTILMNDAVNNRTEKREQFNETYRLDLINLRDAVSTYLKKGIDDKERSEAQVRYYDELSKILENYYSRIPAKFTESHYTYTNLIVPFKAINQRLYDVFDEDIVNLTKLLSNAEKSYDIFRDSVETEIAQTNSLIDSLKRITAQLPLIIERLCRT